MVLILYLTFLLLSFVILLKHAYYIRTLKHVLYIYTLLKLNLIAILMRVTSQVKNLPLLIIEITCVVPLYYFYTDPLLIAGIINLFIIMYFHSVRLTLAFFKKHGPYSLCKKVNLNFIGIFIKMVVGFIKKNVNKQQGKKCLDLYNNQQGKNSLGHHSIKRRGCALLLTGSYSYPVILNRQVSVSLQKRHMNVSREVIQKMARSSTQLLYVSRKFEKKSFCSN